MSDETRNDESSTDEVINDIVEETLEEQDAKTSVKAKGSAKDETPVSEPESIASVDKAASDSPDNSAKNKATIAPKTKAGMISAMFDMMNKKSKADMQSMYNQFMNGDDKDMKKESYEAEESVENVDAVDTAKTELDNLVDNEATLSEEFKEKTAVIFEAAVKSKLSEEIDRLESQYKEELEEEVSSTKSELVEKVDSYLNYVVENWMKENEVAVDNGLRTEIAEGFMDKLKDLFTESYIEVPESKVDLVDELAEQVEELETKLNETTQKVIDQSGELEEMTKERIINESSSDLADTQVEKLKSLVNDLDFEDAEKYAEKVKTIKEAHFSQETGSSEETSMIEEDGHDEVMETSPNMDKYVTALQKTAPKS
tara:strand:- start:1141 stop:2253 length:1113 start_codon:yes stop_codon:yes gene_type:complete